MKKNKVVSLKSNFSGHLLECGCDEAGRGCLAGAVFAAAVVFPKDYKNTLLNDSKKISDKQRYQLRPVIEKEALAWSVATVSPTTIDKINILNASILAMHRAIEGLNVQPEFIIVDGNRFKPYQTIPYETIVKGDAKYLSISAASILAKTYRDDYMIELDKEYPQYEWKKTKGYPTLKHREVIEEIGFTPYHRKSFKLLKGEQLAFEFKSI
ncbi:MAG: ribonuclease HII [Paludibacter sp.]|nr:MAG: ribonuclease HII [Paludibacter sp.]